MRGREDWGGRRNGVCVLCQCSSGTWGWGSTLSWAVCFGVAGRRIIIVFVPLFQPLYNVQLIIVKNVQNVLGGFGCVDLRT